MVNESYPIVFVFSLKSLDSKRRGASVGAFVASTNQTLTTFYSRVIYQRTAQELMDGLAVCMKGIFNHWKKFY